MFYGCDWRFLSLIAFSTTVDYLVGQKLNEDQQHKESHYYDDIIVNLGFLGFFKYYNFLEKFMPSVFWNEH